MRLSPTAARAVVLTGENLVLEVSLDTGAEVARFDGGADQITGVAYVGPDVVASRWIWKGDLWTGRAPFASAQ